MSKVLLFLCAALGLHAQVTMVVQTSPKPVWGPTQTWRVGVTNGLDGTASTGNTGYTWSCTAYNDGTGPASCAFLNFSSTSVSQPTVTGAKTGDHAIQLCDGAGMNCITTHIGARNLDATTGIVTTGSSIADKFYGPMQAIGQNPWGFEDERATTMMGLQWTAINTVYPYNSYSDYNSSWANDQTGTVSWTWNGKGSSTGGTCTTLHTSITSSSISIVVDDATCLDLSSLPTDITIQAASANGVQEQIRICATSGTTGQQTLTVCYDGRGVDGGANANVVVPQSWTGGSAIVGQWLFKGSGTSFLTTLAPGGAGQVGPVPYSTGTVTVTPGSASVTGVGTTWNNTCDYTGTHICAGDAIEVYGTHAGGTPFTWIALISSIGSTTSITASRVYPADADSGTFSYKIVIPLYRWIVSHYTRGTPFSGDALVDWGLTTCESDTQCFGAVISAGPRDIASLNGTSFSGKNYSFIDNANSNYPDDYGFYAPSLAFRLMWYRSGIVQYLQLANAIDDQYVRFPGFADGGPAGYGDILYTGAGGIAATLSYALRGTPVITDMRPTWNVNASQYAPGGGTPNCDGNDTRSEGYYETLLFNGAVYDPDTTSMSAPGGIPWRTYFRNAMATINTWDNACRRTNGGVDTNSWANGFYWNGGGSSIGLTNGSTAGTGTGLASSVCQGVDSGTLQVTNGSSAVTANMGSAFSASANVIVILGKYYSFNRTGSTTGNLSVLWPGSTNAAASYMTENVDFAGVDNFLTTYGMSNSDPALKQNYACIWNNSSSITLDRNFTGSTNTYIQFTSNPGDEAAGYTQQPFMLSIKAYGMNFAAPLDGTLSLNNGTLRNDAAAWLATYGFDNQAGQNGTNGIYWARVCGFCESGGIQDGAPGLFTFTTPKSRYASSNGSPDYATPIIRETNAEGFNGIMQWYIANANSTNRTIVDTLYGALWGSASWDASAVHGFTDSYSLGNLPGFPNLGVLNLSNGYLSIGKYPGFFFGMGMSHEWPALRQCQIIGGVVPVDANGVVLCLPSTSSDLQGAGKLFGAGKVF